MKKKAFSSINKDPAHMAASQEPPYTELERDFQEPEDFYNLLTSKGIDFFTGVPDSLLKDFCGYVADHSDSKHHVITANEGNAVALATGYNLATGKFPLVYLQNSGLGNIVNPVMSLAKIGFLHLAQYQTGKGTPKNLCLDINQSHCNPLTQFSYL